jgi:ParB-like chromosome segregation protein Spo0J
LLAFVSPECALPPVEVIRAFSGRYDLKIINGYHRYYASVAVGYTKLPVVIRPAHDQQA